MKKLIQNIIGKKNNQGFTFVEIAVVISIIMIMSVGSFTMYNHFSHGIDLERSQEQLLSTIDERRMQILNGNRQCAQVHLTQGNTYFSTITHSYDECETKTSLIRDFEINENLEATIAFTPHQEELTLKVFNSRGTVEHFDIDPSDDEITVPVNLTKHYSFVVYNPLERQETESTLDVYFFSEDNLNQEKITQVRIAKIEALNPDLQSIEAEEITMKITLPRAEISVFNNNQRMQSATVTLEKEHTVVDPVSTTLSSITDSPATIKNRKSFTIGEF